MIYNIGRLETVNVHQRGGKHPVGGMTYSHENYEYEDFLMTWKILNKILSVKAI